MFTPRYERGCVQSVTVVANTILFNTQPAERLEQVLLHAERLEQWPMPNTIMKLVTHSTADSLEVYVGSLLPHLSLTFIHTRLPPRLPSILRSSAESDPRLSGDYQFLSIDLHHTCSCPSI